MIADVLRNAKVSFTSKSLYDTILDILKRMPHLVALRQMKSANAIVGTSSESVNFVDSYDNSDDNSEDNSDDNSDSF